MMKKIKGLIISGFIVYFFYACGGGGGTKETPPSPPKPPGATAFINVSSSLLAVFARWSSIEDAKYYNLYYSQYSSLPLKNNEDVKLFKVYRNFTTIITTLPARYYLTVSVVNDAGESSESKRWSVLTTNPPPPPPTE